MSDAPRDGRSSSGLIPYSAIVGQDDMKLALELAYVQPAISGVLLTGERGTAKSTIVRAFARTLYGADKPLVVLPINATEDRVVGGWNVEKLVQEYKSEEMPGLLEEANGRILYIDEVNLLDDHIVNIILDVAASGELVIQREGLRRTVQIQFTIVGTMNPEEGTLRPQLLDRFDLFVQVRAETDRRAEILSRMLALDATIQAPVDTAESAIRTEYRAQDDALLIRLVQARERCHTIIVDDEMVDACARLADKLEADGHRGECVLARSAQAFAAIEGADRVTRMHLNRLARLAFQHRSRLVDRSQGWGEDHDRVVKSVLEQAEK